MVLASEPVGGRSRATELPCFFYYILFNICRNTKNSCFRAQKIEVGSYIFYFFCKKNHVLDKTGPKIEVSFFKLVVGKNIYIFR